MKTLQRSAPNLGRGLVCAAQLVRKSWPLVMLATIALCVPQPAAADSASGEPDWEAKIYGFAWLPAIYSHPSIGPFTTNIDVTADELFRHFRWAVAVGLEDRYRDFLLLADGMGVQYTAGLDAPVRHLPISPGGISGTASTGPSDAG